ncbi:hypothetical protein HPB47_025480, partial [Ixodes persulcatus]
LAGFVGQHYISSLVEKRRHFVWLLVWLAEVVVVVCFLGAKKSRHRGRTFWRVSLLRDLFAGAKRSETV